MRKSYSVRNFLNITLWFLVSASLSAQDFTLNTIDGLPNLGDGALVWADFNNDGSLDIAMTGVNTVSDYESGVYFNNGDGTFSNSGIGLKKLAYGAMSAGDFNNDGLIDLLITGSDEVNEEFSLVYKNLGGGTFTTSPIILEGVARGGATFRDMDNDGLTDVVINGNDNAGDKITFIYHNNGNETFSKVEAGLTGTNNGSLTVVDFDNDSYADVLITGLNNPNQRTTALFKNMGNNVFNEIATVLPEIRSGSAIAGDINADGFLDIVLSGNNTGGNVVTEVFLNNGALGFTPLNTLIPVVDGGGAFGDYDHNGFPNLGLFGFNNPDFKALVYSNPDGNNFVDTNFNLPGTISGDMAWADYNNDSKLDFILNGLALGGAFTNVYENKVTSTNTLPDVPSDLSFESVVDSIILTWEAPADAETVATGLSYNIYIGTASGKIDVLAPLSDVNTGYNRVASPGSYNNNRAVIQGLPEGEYFWSVQAVDPSFGASAFTAEQTFISCDPVKITGPAEVCLNANATFSIGSDLDNVSWYSEENGLLGTGNEIEVTISSDKKIYAEVDKPLGCVVTDTLQIKALDLPILSVVDEALSGCLNTTVTMELVTEETNIFWSAMTDPTTVIGNNKEQTINVRADEDYLVKIEDVNGCLNYDTVHITVLPQPAVDLGDNVSLCQYAGIQFSTGSGSDSVNWYSKDTGLLLANSFEYRHTVNNDDQIIVQVFNVEGCVSYDSVAVEMLALPIVNAGEDKLICDDGTAEIGVEYSNSTDLTFQWTPSETLTAPDIPNPQANPTVDTKYILHVVHENTCESRDTVMVFINRESTIDPGDNAEVCLGQSIQLGGEPTAFGSVLPYSYEWFPPETLDAFDTANPEALPDETTTYGLRLLSGDCVLDTTYVTITVNPIPVIDAGDDVIIGFRESTTLVATGGASYAWYPEELFDNNAISDPVIYPNRTTTYRVEGFSDKGCKATDSVTVTLRSELFVPSLFTPNEDGNNDVFFVHGFGIDRLLFNVYDRWGRLLFSSEDQEQGWDGTINGNEAEQGNYIWTIEGSYSDGQPLSFQNKNKGTIRLIR